MFAELIGFHSFNPLMGNILKKKAHRNTGGLFDIPS